MIAVIDYGAGNTRSVLNALHRLNADARVTDVIAEIQSADKVIFPGVGAAGSAMEKLNNKGLNDVIPELKQPFLGICLGMQLICRNTEESEVSCLDIIPVEVKRFSTTLNVPHMGWNELFNLRGPLFKKVVDSSDVYFIHSYAVPDNNYSIASAKYGHDFCAGVQKDNFFGVQFHPEKSGDIGRVILENFLSL